MSVSHLPLTASSSYHVIRLSLISEYLSWNPTFCFVVQCEDIVQVEKDLQERNIKCTRQVVEEGGIMVDQLFFHDPDGFMIEVCNCEKLPVVPLSTSVASCGLRRCASSTMPTIITTPTSSSDTITQHLQADYRASSEQYAMCV